ncbi:Cyclic pyranopterin monophosphate synthase [Pseudovibrio axinellae]|uniref:Cyclic pyranopterin monophosphate synthase n=1 Tax=Pseudovibrio axinellae TaxID=989403 RepID=A0A165T2H1_9HYPH|nr:radical SAM protein [Pseudovibrio axinellae]KZL05223.1 Cyclic pyranopterin monophosphate synthase [Pseudovibrio axinellae]SER31644.1 Radical SAM superfamily protein [Pseudovibrio axinellae]
MKTCKKDTLFQAEKSGNGVQPKGTYEDSKTAMAESLRLDLPPSPKHIEINNRLVAWEAYLGIGKVSSFPTMLHIGLNDVCNARCAFCMYDPERSTSNRVQVEDIKRAKWLKYVHTILPNAGLSDPLTHPEIAKILDAIHKNAPYIKMHLTTNASLLDNQLTSILAGYLSLIIVSLNAARKETYEFLIPPLKWEKTIGNLRDLQKVKAERQAHLPEIQAGYVLNKHNFEELPELPAVLASLDIRSARIIEMAVPGTIKSRALLTVDDVVPDDKQRVSSVFHEFRKECIKYNINLTQPMPKL